MSSKPVGAGATEILGFKDLKVGRHYRLLPKSPLTSSTQFQPIFRLLSQGKHQLSSIEKTGDTWFVEFELVTPQGSFNFAVDSSTFPDGLNSEFFEVTSGGKRKSRNLKRRKSGKSRKGKGKRKN